MLTEDDLRAVVERAASAAPRPTAIDDQQFADARTSAVTRIRRPRGRMAVGLLAAAVLAVLAVSTALVRDHGSTAKFATVGAPVTEGRADQSSVGLGATASPGAPAGAAAPAPAAPGGSPQERSMNPTPAPLASSSGAADASAPAAPVDSAKVVKNGSVELGVNKGSVAEAVSRVTSMATGFGGYVAGTRTTGGSDGSQVSGTVTIRVPAASFEQLTIDVGKLGDIRSTTTSGIDVTAQYTDLDAKIGALHATHDQLLTILTKADTIPDILSVQDRLNQVQSELDSLEGQRRLLADQTAYGTLAVTVLEPGATVAPLAVDDNPGLGNAWDDAKRGFGDAIEEIVRASGTAVVLLAVGFIGVLVLWLLTRNVRRRLV
ncbi:MAG: hypothetical protein QOH64_777 [Acidimicrobiaceae bacterium]